MKLAEIKETVPYIRAYTALHPSGSPEAHVFVGRIDTIAEGQRWVNIPVNLEFQSPKRIVL